ncbi:hypothetical protein GCM10011360_12960 [Primorskyibacter flagellatus]|uniref:HTH merR-type domain-containing protein n=1 Tax=Primorskyibacter flagellatus TaxID=1387277 RepID=A0A917ED47_9RHOB|nr:MerR family transcriptional regulator [Primorskyibacter flagellatus]GGE25942.1 hypothetical protein GCM10011360_12960 [Primorskyibacter flagellatus]
MAKSADAFRTISEVSEWLDTPAHVLRFWESKFSQVKPVKRAGGRRYYRPSDMELLGGIKRLLHDDGMTIKGVQKLLRDKGIAHVSALSQPLDDLTAAVRDAMDSRARAKEEAEASEAAPAAVSAPADGAAAATTAPDVAAPAAAPVAVPAPVAATPAPAAARVPPANRPLVLSALLTRTAPLPDPARAEIAALQQRLSGWLSRQNA